MPLLQGHPQRAGCLQGLLRQGRPPLGIALAVARQQHLGVGALGADEKAAGAQPPVHHQGTFEVVLGPCQSPSVVDSMASTRHTDPRQP